MLGLAMEAVNPNAIAVTVGSMYVIVFARTPPSDWLTLPQRWSTHHVSGLRPSSLAGAQPRLSGQSSEM